MEHRGPTSSDALQRCDPLMLNLEQSVFSNEATVGNCRVL
jgi:hypothetical protein